MKIKIVLVFFISLFALTNVKGQVALSFSMGMGNYNMEALKEYNEYLIDNLPVEAKLTDDFPMTVFYEGSITYNFRVIHIGAQFTYHTTGSRINYSDYSGEIKIDQVLSARTIGPIVKFNLNPKNRLNFIPFISSNYVFTNYNSNEYIRVFDQNNSEDISFTSESKILNPGIEIVYSLNNFGLSAFGSYSLNTLGDFKYKGEEVSYNGRRFYSDWSGIRFGVKLSYKFKKT